MSTSDEKGAAPSRALSASPFDSIRRADERGEHWSARDLMILLGYDKWERFEDVIDRARLSIATTGGDPDQHLSRVREGFRAPGARGPAGIDFRLTRFGAYVAAMNGHRGKPEIAAAQAYFAVRTREAEVQQSVPALPQSYADALRELAASVEAREALTAKVAELEPAAQSWQQLVDQGGDYLVGDIAKVLKRAGIDTGPHRLYKSMRDLGWVYRTSEKAPWRAMARATDAGWLVHRMVTGTHTRRNGEERSNPPQVRITAKGVAALHARMSRAALELVVGGDV